MLIEKLKKITSFVFDIDGVLTDGRLLVLKDGIHARQMHVKDGFGLQMVLRKGYNLLIISGSFSDEVRIRLERLGVKNIHMSILHKTQFVQDYIEKNKLNWDEVLYMGDDIPDLKLMERVGVSSCPADAVGEIRSVADYISPINGGWGCVRDVIEKVLKIKGDWGFEEEIASK